MDVQGILRLKGSAVVTIRPAETIRDLVGGLARERIGAMVVSEDGQTVHGVISERDVVRGLAVRGGDVLQLAVRDLMTRQVVTCAPTDTVKQVMAAMTRGRMRHLPVVEDGRLVGIISIGDVVKNRLDEMTTEANVLRDAYFAGDRAAAGR
jgi:CBS domain-containing protein